MDRWAKVVLNDRFAALERRVRVLEAENAKLRAQLTAANDPTTGEDHWEPGDPGH